MHNIETVQIVQHPQHVDKPVNDLSFSKKLGLFFTTLQHLEIGNTVDIFLDNKQPLGLGKAGQKFWNLRMVNAMERLSLTLK